ncbi:Hsp20/alpha crystallin family protein [Clostridium gasigenes]|uniref:Hsp20/alpha crystallin family protein n=1 Tax=Clostridium gasigenes TaxID=94869 RepID=UPI0014382D4B|nr:Hsp20/alpha crystallin family protein [Clostridium gasigenes]MBB6625382.1 hypothetical protein [Clostridium gasigenes]MBU3090072.1 Hsp20/alpha crystallin family protein [Clostridium gasigenes]MBU3105964.1 Hsp20/alpha crystallin family protein [Clostridium gasigenes]MBU3134485.1 Hsp20/alpha crystallin family protein [Clostridium gasigenes]MBU3138096.1 Hsp20/alpha crystallin family protein [Clostridium gasigenes]
MVIRNSKNKFSLLKKSSNDNKLNQNTLDIKDNVLVNILDNPYKYTISIYLQGLHKDSIVLSYLNNFLVIDFTFKGNKYSSLKYKRTFYLKDIDITQTQNICFPHLIYITLPKKFQ